jgi:hypothetical protein
MWFCSSAQLRFTLCVLLLVLLGGRSFKKAADQGRCCTKATVDNSVAALCGGFATVDNSSVAEKPLWITLLVYKLCISLRLLVVRSFKIKPQ